MIPVFLGCLSAPTECPSKLDLGLELDYFLFPWALRSDMFVALKDTIKFHSAIKVLQKLQWWRERDKLAEFETIFESKALNRWSIWNA